MKNLILKSFYAVVILGFVWSFAMLTGYEPFAITAVLAVGIGSAVGHSLNLFKGQAFNAPIVPEFEIKTIKEIDELTPEQKDEYFKARTDYEKAKEELAKYNLEKAINEKADLTKEEMQTKLDEMNESHQKRIQELEDAYLLLKSMTEKGGKSVGDQMKDELSKYLLRDRTEEYKSKKDIGMTEVVGKAAALMTTSNIIPNATDGFNQLFGNSIDPTIHVAPKDAPFIMQLVDTQMTPGTENHWYVQRINEDGDAAFIGEGDAKPLIDGEYKEFKAEVKEVAEFWKFSEKLMLHTMSVVNDFREHADELIELKMDEGVLTGDGTGDNLEGITTAASPFVVPLGLANYYEYVNIFDVIMAVATYVKINKFKGELVCVLNTVWEAKMKGIKDSDGRYIIPPFVSPDGTKVGQVTVRFENQLDEDYILLGDLKKFKCRISERLMYAEGWENDDFRKNLVSRRLAAFLATYMPSNYDGSIIYDEISTIEAAIADTSS